MIIIRHDLQAIEPGGIRCPASAFRYMYPHGNAAPSIPGFFEFHFRFQFPQDLAPPVAVKTGSLRPGIHMHQRLVKTDAEGLPQGQITDISPVPGKAASIHQDLNIKS